MFESKDEEEHKETKQSKKKAGKKSHGKTEIMPLRSFYISYNEIQIDIKEGVSVEVPNIFLQNLKTEKVI